MFTGLVDSIGKIESAVQTPAGRTFRIGCPYADLAPGESVSVNGACLTVRECGPHWFTAAAVATTLDRTAIGQWTPGQAVNLERALRLGDRMGGHLVQGHVDGLGVVRARRPEGDATLVDVALPPDLMELLVLHGSVTLDGVSLTVNSLPSSDVVQVSLIDYTLRHTTLGAWAVGDDVHVEVDVIGKYVRRLVAPYLTLDR